MQFNDNVVTEIIVPSNVPFQPGNDVIGIGTQLPSELAAFVPYPSNPSSRITAALTFYTSSYNKASTKPQCKYMWIGIASNPGDQQFHGAALMLGSCYVANPSVSQTGVVNAGFSVSCEYDFTTAAFMSMFYPFHNHANVDIALIGENTAADSGGVIDINDANDVHGIEAIHTTPSWSSF